MKMSLLDRLRGPLLVEAQDPPVPTAPAAPADVPATPDPAALGAPVVEEPVPTPDAAPAPEAKPVDELAADDEGKPEEEEEKSPIVNWPEHLQDIANDIQGTLQAKVEISEDRSRTVPVGNDPDLGYHIVGLVQFPEGIPADIKMKLQGRPLKYSAYVSPEGELGTSVDLFFSTTDPYEVGEDPTYHVNRNQYRIVS